MLVRVIDARRSFRTKYGEGFGGNVLAVRQMMVADDQVDPQLARHPGFGVRFYPDVGGDDDLKPLGGGALDDLARKSVTFGEAVGDVTRDQIARPQKPQRVRQDHARSRAVHVEIGDDHYPLAVADGAAQSLDRPLHVTQQKGRMQIIDEFRRQELSNLSRARKTAIEQAAEQYPVLPGLQLQTVQLRRGARRPRDRIVIDYMPARASEPTRDFGQRWRHASFKNFQDHTSSKGGRKYVRPDG